MMWPLIVKIILNVLNIICHSFGIYILFCLHRNGKQKIQHTLFLNLSVNIVIVNLAGLLESILRLPDFLKTLQDYLSICENTGIFFVYILSFVYITFDRFLEVQLNIKYLVYVTELKVKFLLSGTWMCGILLCLAMLLLDTYNTFDVVGKHLIYVYIGIDIIYLLITTAMHAVIFHKFRKSRKRPSDTRSCGSKGGKMLSISAAFRNSRFYVSCIIVFNYILLTISPEFIYNLCRFHQQPVYIMEVASFIIPILTNISTLIDFYIYVWMDCAIRKMLKNYYRCSRLSGYKNYRVDQQIKVAFISKTDKTSINTNIPIVENVL